MTYKTILPSCFLAACLLTLLACSTPETATKIAANTAENTRSSALPKPNILLLMAEDMSSRVGAFGDNVAVTPNIDQLASEGVRYTNAFTTAGVCAPSRAAIIMGAHQASFGGQHMRTSTRPAGAYKAVPPADMKAFPELLRANGYYTYNLQKLDYQFSGPMSGSGPFTIWDDDSQDAHWRNKQSDQPFFGYVTFMVTHESGVFPPLGAEPYSKRHAIMQQWRAQALGVPPVNSPVKAQDIHVEPYYPDTPTVRADIARHYNNIAIMDKQVGAILKQLKDDNLLDNTIVIWTTDHGDGLPRAKRDLYDSGINVPLIIRWPEKYRPANSKPNSLDERLISVVDLAPTILALAGVESGKYMSTNNFTDTSKPLPAYIFAARDRIDEIADRQRAARDDRFKYIYSDYPQQQGGHPLAFRDNIPMMREMAAMFAKGNLNDNQQAWFLAPGKERLYDLEKDPYELNDVSKSSDYTDDLQRMRAALHQWQAEVDDWSKQPESAMVKGFLVNGVTATTPPPQVFNSHGKTTISAQHQASIGFRRNQEPWQLYTQAIELAKGDQLQAKAIRYGWNESTVTVYAK